MILLQIFKSYVKIRSLYASVYGRFFFYAQSTVVKCVNFSKFNGIHNQPQ